MTRPWLTGKMAKAPAEVERHQVAFRGQQLALGRFADDVNKKGFSWAGACPLVMTSVESAQALPAPPPPASAIRTRERH